MKPELKLIKPAEDRRHAPKLLTVTGVGKGFHSEGAYLNVLTDITFDVRRGELVCILGRSGCGKTTLLNIVAGFLASTAGRITLNGRPLKGPGPDRCVVFQEDTLFPWLTVEENIAFGLRKRGKNRKKMTARVDEFVEMVGLAPFRTYLPRQISGGMKQRVALARVLILDPAVLLMDEPFGALDAQSREEMQTLLLTIWQRLAQTILFVTHDVTEAVLLADRILVMDAGPGRVRREFEVNLPRPRDAASAGFIEYCSLVRKELKQ